MMRADAVAMTSRPSCLVPLPASFRPSDVLSFHRRDAQEVAERVTDTSLEKGMIWKSEPACLTILFQPGRADAELAIDGGSETASSLDFEIMVRRMLGLTQGIEEFERHCRTHSQIGALIARQSGLRVPATATPFEALTWAIAGQQISVSAAVSLRRKLIIATNVRHSSGLMCYPEASHIAGLTEQTLRQAGFSRTKASTLLTLSKQVIRNTLPLDIWTQTVPVEEIREALQAVRGIGPWTVNYALLRGFGWLDGSLHDDAAVRRALQAQLNLPEKISEKQTKEWLAEFSPWRALIAAHLWASLSSVAY